MEEGYTSDESHLMVDFDLLPAPSPFDSMVCSSSSFDVDFDLLPSVGSPSSSCIVVDFDLLSSNSPSGLPADASSVLDENFGALPNSCESISPTSMAKKDNYSIKQSSCKEETKFL